MSSEFHPHRLGSAVTYWCWKNGARKRAGGVYCGLGVGCGQTRVRGCPGVNKYVHYTVLENVSMAARTEGIMGTKVLKGDIKM